ncbi:MAG: GNAT family N-acetyltransferase [Gemmatimonadaceae bacterium]|nr:GNAT family N-acetyltransferase [Gemmatimonadaceae bacterium]
MTEHSITHEEHGTRGAFFIEQNGQRVAELTYGRVSGAVVNIDHTEVASSLRGQGVARQLLDAAVRWARETHTQLSATCSYAVVQFARDTSLRDVLSPDALAGSDAAACEIRRPGDPA